MAVALVALGLGSVAFGLVGFKVHQADADDLGQLAQQNGGRSTQLSPDVVHPSERMARWNLLIWTGVGFSYFGVSLAAANAMLQRIRARRQSQGGDASSAEAATAARDTSA